MAPFLQPMVMCPTLQRLLEVERDAWFGAVKTSGAIKTKDWEKYVDCLAKLLHRDDLEDYLLEEDK